MMQPVIMVLAGGSGERLWPLSRERLPKQLIPFTDGRSLLEQTIGRLEKSPLFCRENIAVITSLGYADIIRERLGNRVGRVLAEEAPRNTGPAILYGCLQIVSAEQDPVVVVLPADHFIPDAAAFNEALATLVAVAQERDVVALLGLRPRHAATGYGYIQATGGASQTTRSIVRFHEKPSSQLAAFYAEQADYYWNLGIFVARVSVWRAAFAQHAPDLYDHLVKVAAGQAHYRDAQKISIDYCLMEKATNLVMVPASFEWHDIGNLSSFLSVQAAHAAAGQPVISLQGSGNLALTSKKVVAVVGLSEVCVVETEDAILVVSKEYAEAVRQVVPLVKEIEASLG